MNIFIQLFLSFFQIGLFSIGGGYAAMPLIQSQVVEIHQWLTMTQFADIITIAEMTPGPIAINSATFVGTHIAGLPGAIIATIGCVAPSCIIVLSLAYVYTKYKNLSLMKGILSGLRPVVIALIASAGLSICKLAFFDTALCLIGCLYALFLNILHPVLMLSGLGIMALGGLIAVAAYTLAYLVTIAEQIQTENELMV